MLYNLQWRMANSGQGIIVLSVIAAIVIYFTFLSPKNEGKFTGFKGFIYDFLSFKKFLLEAVIKIIYLILACMCTLSSIAMMFNDFIGAIIMCIVSNIIIRIIYEFILLLVMICKNTTEINRKLSKEEMLHSSKEMFISHVDVPQEVTDKVVSKVSSVTSNIVAKKQGCNVCGQELKEEDLFCPSCGTKTK